MKLYVVNDYKIYTYSLPLKIEDAFIINYEHYNGVEETITFRAEENNWVIESTPDILYYNGTTKIEKDTIKNGSIYSIQFSDLSDRVSLYCFDEHQMFFDYEIPGNKYEIFIGRTGVVDILYDNPNVGSPELKIFKQNNFWFVEDGGTEQNKVYLNNRRIKKSYLNIGDIIFTNGLKIIWMDSYIKITNPNNLIKTSLPTHEVYGDKEERNKYTPTSDAERAISLFNDNQVFFHTPRMIEELKEREIQIKRPPGTYESQDAPAILTLGATSLMGITSAFTGFSAILKVSTGKATLSESMSEIVMCVTMILGSMFFPIAIDRYNKSRNKRLENKRKKIYREYLQSLSKEIDNELNKEVNILNNSFASPEQLSKYIYNRSNKVWCREIADNDFLTLRLGIGNKNSLINLVKPDEGIVVEKDVLVEEMEQLTSKQLVLQNIPITISLIKDTILPIVISYDYLNRRAFINSLLLQLIGCHSGNELKIVIFTTNNDKDQWDFLKYLPHSLNETRKFRFFAETEDEAKQVSNYLEKEYEKRFYSINGGSDSDEDSFKSKIVNQADKLYRNFDNYYVIITDNYVVAKKYGIIKKIMDNDANFGFSLITVEPTMQNVPSKCQNIVQVDNTSAGIINRDLTDSAEQITFVPDLLNDNIETYSSIIANIPLATESVEGKLPTSLSFLDMFKVGKIEQLNVLNRWRKNDPTLSIATTIGVRTNGRPFELDLHEKFHGPHGLIAGSTGSGKSEFIITFILSMCINYHPYEVQFVLIDYKGGGLAGAFENKETGIKIPHLAGTITNLDVSEMSRTLVSINSELKRRQRLFNEARDSLNESTIDIYKYQKYYREGKVKEPMSHLFIISDEFAELKSQQPEFMESLVSTARIGRSLGVHLILATQKPAGVVNDQIWSNSKFKICLKVATADDSRELLRRPEAAEIKETGRFYLQVGYNELFELGQSGWAGAKYNPADHIVKNIDDSVDIIDNIGTNIKSINDIKVESTENHGEQLTNIVKMLYDISIREKIEFKSMWLPSLSTETYLSDIIKKYNYKAQQYVINPIIGEYDDPEMQYQGPYNIDLNKGGNILMAGLAGSGKENFIMTLLYSICMYHTSDEVNIYIMDFGAEILKVFSSMPQVGDIVLSDDKDKVKSLFLMIEREMVRRKEEFSEFGGNYNEYIKNSGKKTPMMIVVINAWESFSEQYSGYTDLLSHFVRESAKYGIIILCTINSATAISSTIQQNFTNKIGFQFSDKYDYNFFLNNNDTVIPKKATSRGATIINEKMYEFQAAYVCDKDKINDAIKATAEKLSKTQKKAHHIPVIPSVVSANTLAPYITNLSKIPLGFDIKSGDVYSMDFLKHKIVPIIGNYIITETDFIFDLLNVLNLLQDTKLKIIDFAGIIEDSESFEDYANDEFTAAIKKIEENEAKENKAMIYVLVGIAKVYDRVLDEGVEKLFNILNNTEKYEKSYFVIVDNYSSYKKIMSEEWYKKVPNNLGIWVGADINTQNAIDYKMMSKSDLNEEFSGIVYTFDNGSYSVLKGIGSKPEEGY